MVFMMDNITSKDGHFDADLEKGIISDELCSNSIGGFHFGPIRMNQSQTEGVNGGVVNCSVSLMVVDKMEGEEKGGDVKKPKAISAKKPPKPPRPPRGLSLDSADQKLIRELHELAKLKRARIERMKALKKAKELKTSSSSKNHVFGTLLTVLFCLVLLFQGISSRTNSAVKFQGSPISSEATKDNVISIQHLPSSSASHVHKPGSEFPRWTSVFQLSHRRLLVVGDKLYSEPSYKIRLQQSHTLSTIIKTEEMKKGKGKSTKKWKGRRLQLYNKGQGYPMISSVPEF